MLHLGQNRLGPVWVRYSFLVQSAKAEGVDSCNINMANESFLLVNGKAVLGERTVVWTDLL